jgi:hypothetical protein
VSGDRFNYSVTIAESWKQQMLLNIVKTLRTIQDAGGLGFRLESNEKGQNTIIFFFRRTNLDEATRRMVDDVLDLLRLEKGRKDFRILYGPVFIAPDTISIDTRSLLQVLMEFSADVTIPEAHAKEGRAVPIPPRAAHDPQRLMRIHSGTHNPANAFVKVWHRDHLFWIDDRDLMSKRSVAFLMFLFSLADVGPHEPPPVLTSARAAGACSSVRFKTAEPQRPLPLLLPPELPLLGNSRPA